MKKNMMLIFILCIICLGYVINTNKASYVENNIKNFREKEDDIMDNKEGIVATFQPKTNETEIYYEVYSKSIKNVEYPQITGMKDDSIQTKINDNLAYVFKYVIDLNVFNSYPPEIIYQNEHYLSTKTVLWYSNPNVGVGKIFSCPIYQTISIDTGKLLQLDDFLEISDTFVEYLYNSPTAIRAVKQEDADWVWNESSDHENRCYIKEKVSGEAVMNYLKEASINYDNKNYMNKCTFYLLPNEMNIVYEQLLDSVVYFKIRLELDDIEQFLKVSKW